MIYVCKDTKKIRIKNQELRKNMYFCTRYIEKKQTNTL